MVYLNITYDLHVDKITLFLIVTVPLPKPNAKCKPSGVQAHAFILAGILCLSTLFFSGAHNPKSFTEQLANCWDWGLYAKH